MDDKPLLIRLKAWLKKDGNSYAKIATALGYRSSTTINKWIENDAIPYWKREATLKFLTKGKKK